MCTCTNAYTAVTKNHTLHVTAWVTLTNATVQKLVKLNSYFGRDVKGIKII